MIYVPEFKEWLMKNTSYSAPVISDTISRMKRADKILEWKEEDIYQFKLEQLEEYKKMSISVRSQIKKSVKLYSEFYISQKEKGGLK